MQHPARQEGVDASPLLRALMHPNPGSVAVLETPRSLTFSPNQSGCRLRVSTLGLYSVCLNWRLDLTPQLEDRFYMVGGWVSTLGVYSGCYSGCLLWVSILCV